MKNEVRLTNLNLSHFTEKCSRSWTNFIPNFLSCSSVQQWISHQNHYIRNCKTVLIYKLLLPTKLQKFFIQSTSVLLGFIVIVNMKINLHSFWVFTYRALLTETLLNTLHILKKFRYWNSGLIPVNDNC